ncbi:MAG: exopolysaccharide biosynthesis protein [Dethiobacter sp.]|nr:exopolysaccharide biosynthesis protein [Dethiobacter sp.]
MPELSERIKDLVSRHSAQGVTLGQLLDKMDRQGVGFLMALLSLPLLVPLPPGVGAPAGILLLVWSSQRLFGARVPWCPAFLRRRRFSPQVLEKLADRGLPIIRKLEKYGSGNGVLTSEPAVKTACLVVMLMATLIILPTPFLNPLFATVVLLLGISLSSLNVKLYAAGIFGGAAVILLLLSLVWTAFLEGRRFFGP